MIEIYGSNDRLKCQVEAGSSSQQDKALQSDNVLSLSFTHYAFLELDVNDWCEFAGERYWLQEKYLPKQKNEHEWEYNVKLYGIESLIKRLLVLQNSDGENEAVFTLTAPASEHVRLIVQSMNDGMDHTTNWKVGDVVATENLTIDYDGTYCDEGLRMVAEAAGTEWWIEGETVNLCRCEQGTELVLRYGESLLSLDRDEADGVKFYTRLFPIGSSRNIDRSKYSSTRLQLPGGAKYVDIPDLAEKYGVFHHYEQEAFSGIYPRRVGVISSVRWEEVNDPDGNPFTIWYFKDNGLTFDPNDYEIAGLVKHVSFQSGELEGRDFEVNYNSSTREFEIITTWPYDDDMQLPDVHGGQLIPAPGNTYILWNIRMPDEYYDLAEKEYQSAVEAFNREHLLDKSVYKAPTNPKWVERSGAQLYVGRRVRLESQKCFPKLGYRSSRITRLTRKVSDPYQIDLEISDAVSTGTMTKIEDRIHDVKMYVRESSSVLPDIIRSWETTKPTDNNIYSARRTHKEFLSKQSDDIAQGVIGFVSGLWVKAKGLFGIDGEGNGRFNNIDFSGILSGLRAVINNIESGNYDGDGTSGSGWQLTNDDGTGNSRLVVDNLYVRMKSVYNELEIRKMLHTAGNYIFSPAGSIIEQVDYYEGEKLLGYEAVKVPWVLRLVPLSLRGKLLSRTRMRKVSTLSDEDMARVTKFRCWVVADDGTTRTINTWKVGMLARCETFNVAGGKDAHADDTDSGIISEVSEVSGKATGNKFYWREVTETGEGQKLYVDDGKVHNYVDLTNEDGFFFPGSDWPSAGDSIVCYGVTDESLAEYSNIVIIETVGADAPAIKEFQNVGLWGDGETRKGAVNWSLAGKMRTKISPRTGNKFYGEFLVWVKDGWQDMTTTFEIRLGEVRSEIRAVRDTNMLTGVIDGSGWVDFEERLVKAGVTRDGGLYSASGKIISPLFDGGHELYYFSFYAKGEVTLKLNRFSDASDDRTADMVSSEVLHVSVAYGDTYNGMQRYYTNAQVTEGFYCLLFEGTSADNAVYFPQAEEGQLTPFVVSGMETGSAITQSADRISLEVKNVRDGLLSTGIDIEHDEIRLRSNKTSFVSTRDGHTYIGVGEDDDGIPYFIFYDKDGEPKYNLGYTGLKELIDNARPSRYEAVSFYCDAPYGFQPGEKLNPKTVYDNFDADTVPFWYWYEGYTKGADGSKIWSVGGTEASKWNEKYYSDKEETGTPSHPKNFAGLNDEEYDFSGWFFQKTDSFSGSSISGFNCLVKYIENGVVVQTFYASVELNSIIALTGKPPEVWYRISLYRTKEARDKNEWPAWSGYANSKGKNEDDDSDAFSEYMTVPIEAGGKRGSLVMPSPTD